MSNPAWKGLLSSKAFNRKYYEEHKLAGLDYLGHGEWQEKYAGWLVDCLALKNKHVLDVGCACGSIVRGFGKAGALVSGIDVSEDMLNLGRERWPDMAPILHVCDAVNMHIWRDSQFNAIHSAQVAEHWKPELVPFILGEIYRVTCPGGLFICFLDTEEMYARQDRKLENEDPTHVCVKPMAWWKERLAEAGWKDCSEAHWECLKRHPNSFFTHYDWDWFLVRRS